MICIYCRETYREKTQIQKQIYVWTSNLRCLVSMKELELTNTQICRSYLSTILKALISSLLGVMYVFCQIKLAWITQFTHYTTHIFKSEKSMYRITITFPALWTTLHYLTDSKKRSFFLRTHIVFHLRWKSVI